MGTKTDNANLASKLELRRYFLRKYHADHPPAVFDCCQGSAVLWSTLRDDHAVASYYGVDMKPKKGRLKIDSQRILSIPGWRYDVIDVDTYWSPWKHYREIVRNMRQPATVFLTIGIVRMGGGGGVDPLEADALGMRELIDVVPRSLIGKLHGIGVEYSLALAHRFGVKILEAVEALPPGKNARYIGCRLGL